MLTTEQIDEAFERGSNSARQGAGQVMADPVLAGLRAVAEAAAEDALKPIRAIMAPDYLNGRILQRYIGAEDSARIHDIERALNGTGN